MFTATKLYRLIFCVSILFFIFAYNCSAKDEGRSAGIDKEKKSEDAAGKIVTISSVEHFESTVEKAGDRLLVFDLYADWCMPCKILSPMLEKIALEHKDIVSVYKINVDKQPTLARAFGVRGIPYVVFVKNKQAVHAFTGVQPKEAYVRAIKLLVETKIDEPVETPDGEIINGVREITRSPLTSVGNIYVYRGDSVSISIGALEGPMSIHIPEYNISRDAKAGDSLQVSFKARDIGTFPVYCNGQCPSGDGAQQGQIIVMQYEGESGSSFKELSVEEAEKFIQKEKPLILDVRTPNEYYRGHLENAKLIPLSQLASRVNEIESYKNKPILIYCRSGNRSTVAAQILSQKGFKHLSNLRPGLKVWERKGNTVVK